MTDSSSTLSTYADASDEAVLRNFDAACAAEVAAFDRGEAVPAILAGACDAWMREGIRRGIL